MATLKAFSLAFKPGEAVLTFKVSGVDDADPQYQFFRKACYKERGVFVITECMSQEELEYLYLRNDIYLSLHRSEGYGLTIREAMLHGLYVVATGWSWNIDFMNREKAFTVQYTLVPIDM